jgi:hypothetical protein
LAQGNNLNLEFVTRSQIENDGGEQGKQNAKHELRGYKLDAVSAMIPIWRKFSASTAENAGVATVDDGRTGRYLHLMP